MKRFRYIGFWLFAFGAACLMLTGLYVLCFILFTGFSPQGLIVANHAVRPMAISLGIVLIGTFTHMTIGLFVDL